MDTTRTGPADLSVVVRLDPPPLPAAGSSRGQRLERLQVVQLREAARLHARVLGQRHR